MLDGLTSLDGLRTAFAARRVLRPSSDFDLNADEARFTASDLRDAAVLIPIVARASGLHVILTKRSTALKHHPGQIAFAGGKRDASDVSLEHTALRESWEEIGLRGDQVDVIGELPPHTTVTAFTVTPIVGIVDPNFVPTPEQGEVEEVFEVPLAHVLDSNNYLIEGRIWSGKERYYYTVPCGPYYIWGATARMLRMFASCLRGSDAY